MTEVSHQRLTIDQFTRQAVPFTKLPGHSTSLELLAELSQLKGTDEVLDVACGPGIVACYFAEKAQRVTGVDLTPEMLRQARRRQEEQGLKNLEWVEGSGETLPFPDHRFSLVVSRYAFHHFERPETVLAEMCRICQPGGIVLVADVCLPAEQVAAYDALEKLRDPSHVHVLSRDEICTLFENQKLQQIQFGEYKVELTVEEQLAASFPVPGGAEEFRRLLENDVTENRFGVSAHQEAGVLSYAVPIVAAAGRKS